MSDLTAAVRRSASRRYGSQVGAYVILGLGSILMLSPFIYQFLSSFMTHSEMTGMPPALWPSVWRADAYVEVFTRLPFAAQMGNSILFACIRTASQILFCSMAGYAFARMRFAGKNAIFAVFLAIMMVPSGLLLIPQYQIIQSLGWLNTVQGVVAPDLIAVFGTFLMRQFFLTLPKELEEAGRIDGAGPARIFFTIMLPLAAPGISAMAVIQFLAAWSDLLWPLVVTTREASMPLSVGLATLQGEPTLDYPVLMAASFMASLPVIVFFLFMQRRVIDGLAQSGVKG